MPDVDLSAAADVPPERARWILALIGAWSLLSPAIFYVGPRDVDHFAYIRIADDLLRGEHLPTSHPQTTRYGWLLPEAGIQFLLGTNDFSTAVLPALSSLLHVLATFALGATLISRKAGLWSAGILSAIPAETIHASLLYPDLLVASLGAAATAILVREQRRDRPEMALVLTAGALLGWGMLIKQTTIFYIVAGLVWVMRGRRWRHLPALVPVGILLLAQATALWAIAGDPLLGLTRASAGLADHLRQHYFRNASEVAARLTWQIPSILFNPLDRQFPAWGGLTWALLAAAWLQRGAPPVRFLLSFAGILLFLAWFWPARLIPFLPALIADDRHLLFLLMPMSIVVATGLLKLPRRARGAAVLVLGTACLVSTAVIHGFYSREAAGPRAAAARLREIGSPEVRAVDLYGNPDHLYSYLLGRRKGEGMGDFTQEGLATLHGVYICLDDRGLVRSRAGRPRRPVSELEIPAGWETVWSGEFPEPWDPRAALLGRRTPRTYRVRIYCAP